MPKWDKWLDEEGDEREPLQKIEKIKKKRPKPRESDNNHGDEDDQ